MHRANTDDSEWEHAINLLQTAQKDGSIATIQQAFNSELEADGVDTAEGQQYAGKLARHVLSQAQSAEDVPKILEKLPLEKKLALLTEGADDITPFEKNLQAELGFSIIANDPVYADDPIAMEEAIRENMSGSMQTRALPRNAVLL